ncbi:MAG: preprotein translocase subunit SecE [Bacilli bacterium]|nr:preprotein translocase subunit SecE [Bacilli bacterium]
MAEVRKRVLEDKYNTKSIKTTKTKKETKKVKTTTVKKKETKKIEKKGIFTKFRIFCHGVASEFKKVHWPNKKDMVKYSIATIIFIIFCGLFFYAIDVIFALIRTLV